MLVASMVGGCYTAVGIPLLQSTMLVRTAVYLKLLNPQARQAKYQSATSLLYLRCLYAFIQRLLFEFCTLATATLTGLTHNLQRYRISITAYNLPHGAWLHGSQSW